jgi:chromosome segregation ATPase
MSHRYEDALARSKRIVQESMELTRKTREADKLFEPSLDSFKAILDIRSPRLSSFSPEKRTSTRASSKPDTKRGSLSDGLLSQVSELTHKVKQVQHEKDKFEKITEELRYRISALEALEKENQSLKRENKRLRGERGSQPSALDSEKFEQYDERISDLERRLKGLRNEIHEKDAIIQHKDKKLKEIVSELGDYKKSADKHRLVDYNEFIELQRKYEETLRSRTEIQDRFNQLYLETYSQDSKNKKIFQNEITEARSQLNTLENEYKAELTRFRKDYEKLEAENVELRKRLKISEELQLEYNTVLRKLGEMEHLIAKKQTTVLSSIQELSPNIPTRLSTNHDHKIQLFNTKIRENSEKIKQLENRLAFSVEAMESLPQSTKMNTDRSSKHKKSNRTPTRKSVIPHTLGAKSRSESRLRSTSRSQTPDQPKPILKLPSTRYAKSTKSARLGKNCDKCDKRQSTERMKNSKSTKELL